MLNSGKFTAYLQSGLWAEVVNTAMILENNLITPTRTKKPFQQFFGKGKQNVLVSMQKFGEMCITTFKDNTHQAKLANQGSLGIWVGYAENHPPGTYRNFNPKTKRIILTRDVTFLQKSYGEYSKVEKPVVLNMSYEKSDDQEELKIVPVDNKKNDVNVFSNSNSDSSDKDFKNNKESFFDEDNNDQVISSYKTTVNAKVIWAMKKLQASYNNDVNKIIKEAMQDKVAKNNYRYHAGIWRTYLF